MHDHNAKAAIGVNYGHELTQNSEEVVGPPPETALLLRFIVSASFLVLQLTSPKSCRMFIWHSQSVN